jgi:hypothetical protein
LVVVGGLAVVAVVGVVVVPAPKTSSSVMEAQSFSVLPWPMMRT